MSLRTNFGRVFHLGGNGGSAFTLDLPLFHEIRGVGGNTGDYMDNICVFTCENESLARGNKKQQNGLANQCVVD